MSAHRHTPGPWHIEDTNSAKLTMVVAPDEAGSNAGWVVIGQVGGPNKEANARMISAAPDMLDALHQARAWLESWASAEEQLAVINAAIVKAEGGAS